jgi:Ca-activated chloride channel family protein
MRDKTVGFKFALLLGSLIATLVGNTLLGYGAGLSGLKRGKVSAAARDNSVAARDNNRAPQSATGSKIVIGANLVNIAITVSDSNGRFIAGLNKNDFEIFDDGVKQELAHFSDQDAPISIGIVYDVSGSMGSKIERSFRALSRFVETSLDEDAFFLITFNGRSTLAQDFTRGDPRPIVDRLASIKPHGQTALYDAVYLALEKVRQGPHSRQAILVVSDGQDNSSSHTFAELSAAVRESGVIIYTVGIGGPSRDPRPDVGRFVLNQIAEMSGGRSFFPVPYDDSALAEDCARIALELRHQYSIGFYPTGPTVGARRHKIRVRVVSPRTLGRLSLAYKGTYDPFQPPSSDAQPAATEKH